MQPRVVLRLVALSAVSLQAFGQGSTGEITGTVRDATDALVPGATVVITNEATGATRRATTNEAGIYVVPALPPATYTVTVEHTGFQSQTRRDVLLQVQQIARADFSMRLGQVAEAVEVTGMAPLLATEDTTVGQVIENKRIIELPLNGRNYLQLAALSPGVNINSSPSAGANDFQGGHRARQSVTVNGQRGQFNHYTLDGIENTDPNFNTYILLPSIDALQEFKVQTATYPAEYGYGVSQINVTTKSGTNSIRGTLFEYLRNDKLDAKNFFDDPRQPIPPFKRNQFGGTIGGPLVRNKLFYFGNYEGLREVKSLTAISSIPLAAARQGNFAGGRPIYDPLTRVQQPNGTITAQQFPGNVIPSNRISATSLTAMQNFWPEPNQPGTARNYLNNEPRRFTDDQFTIRMDYLQSDNLTWFGRYSYAKDKEYTPAAFPGHGTWTNTRPDQVLGGATWVITPNLVNNARFGWSRFDNQMVGTNSYVNDVNGELLKIPGLNLSNDPAFWGVPAFGILGFTGFGDRTHIYLTHNNQYEGSNDLSWIRGKHVMKFGFSVKPIQYNQLGNQFALGGFDFDGTVTENPASRPGTGEPMADFLLGTMIQSYTAVQAADAQLRSTYWSGYFADTWKVTSRLTLDLGIRYEYLPPFRDINDQSVNIWGLGTANPILVRASNQGEGRDPYENQLVRFTRAELVRDGRLGPGLVRPDRNNWAPRLGLAYSVDNNTVVRAGFGVFYNIIDLGNSIYDMARTLAGLRRDFSDRDRPDLSFGGQPFRTGPESGTVPLPQPLILANSPDMRTAYVNQWTLNVQRSITPALLVDIGYVGSQSHRLKKFTGWNNPLPGPGAIDARRPYQQFGWIQYPDSIGNGNYHALQVKLEQRFKSGFTILTGYTFGKSIDDTSGVRPGSGDTLFVNNPWCNNSCERARSGFDSRHRWVTSALYELPFGRGRQFLGSAGGFVNALLGGWQMGGILTLESGLPATPGAGRDVANVGTGSGNRPNATGINPNLPRDQQSVDHFFNTAAFVEQPLYTFGNAGRNVIEGPGIISLDFSTMKRFPIGESRYVEFRGEIFNLPNHPIFGMPTTNLRSATYGRLTSTRIDSRQIQLALRFSF
jgi:hypothetical protein